MRKLLPGFWLLFVTVMAGIPANGASAYYTFVFQTQALGQSIPSGSFFYDSATGVFSDFVVVQDGSDFDFTAEANQIGGRTRLPFELGILGQNLIDGFGPLGPELSHWYAGPEGFFGFEWRTPANDFLYYDLTVGAPAEPISSSPRAFAGTWSTITGTPTPEPAFPGAIALLLAIGGAARRAAKAAVRELWLQRTLGLQSEPSNTEFTPHFSEPRLQ